MIDIVDRAVVEQATIRAVAFDFDDTIVRSPVSWRSVMAELFVEVLYPDVLAADRASLHTGMTERITADSGVSLSVFMDRLAEQAARAGVAGARSAGEYRALFDACWRSAADDDDPAHQSRAIAMFGEGLLWLNATRSLVLGDLRTADDVWRFVHSRGEVTR
ncbi:hypothetical protein [Actinophytocola sp.]|uniref:hypothetical protein n=1 Tax=Actinophytocola sp. TaxID=1872138 RepID=UPI003D6C67DA